MNERHVLFINGELGDLGGVKRELRENDYLIGVDGGTAHILSLGLIPHVVIGDLDSISAEAFGKIEQLQVPTIRHPAKKDSTDLELALEYSISRSPKELLLISAFGGRVDHALANTLLLGSQPLSKVRAQLYDGTTRAQLLRPAMAYEIAGTPGQIFSLLPLSTDVVVKELRGAEWGLQDSALPFGSARGVSNVYVEPSIRIRLRSGMLLVVTTSEFAN